MGLFSNESTSKTSVNAPTEKSPITATGASVAVRAGGAHFDTVSNGTQIKLGQGARLNITQTSDPKLLENIVSNQNATLEQFLTGNAQARESSDKSLAEVLSKLTDLAENKQTGGESGRDKTILYIVLSALGGVAVIFGQRNALYVVAAGVAAWFLFRKDQ